MGDEKASDGKTDIADWLTHFKIQKYTDALYDCGLESLDDIKAMDNEDIAEAIEGAKIKRLQVKKFRKAVAAVQAGSYKPKAKVKASALIEAAAVDGLDFLDAEAEDDAAQAIARRVQRRQKEVKKSL